MDLGWGRFLPQGKQQSPSLAGSQKRRKALDLTYLELVQRIKAARNMGVTFLHGAVFVPLAGVNSINLMVTAIANALDSKFDDSSELFRATAQASQGKINLPNWENLEQLLDGGWTDGGPMLNPLHFLLYGTALLVQPSKSRRIWSYCSRVISPRA